MKEYARVPRQPTGTIPRLAKLPDALAPKGALVQVREDLGDDSAELVLESPDALPVPGEICAVSGPREAVRPSSFLVVPASSRIAPAVRSTRAHVRGKTSDWIRHAVSYPIVAARAAFPGRLRTMARKAGSSRNPARGADSRSMSKAGTRSSFPFLAASRRRRFNIANSRTSC